MKIKYFFWGAASIFFVLAIWGAKVGSYYLNLLTNTAASMTCNLVFAAGQPAQWVTDTEIPSYLGMNAGPDDPLKLEIDGDTETVSASLLGLSKKTWRNRPGYGCGSLKSLAEVTLPPHRSILRTDALPLPAAAAPYPSLNAYLEEAFDSHGEETNQLGNRGVVILHHGRIVAEYYAAPFEKNTRQWSYSMAKSINATLWGIADTLGYGDLDAVATVPEWAPDDTRSAITNRNLINMTSGLEFDEDYSAGGEFPKMIMSGDTAGYGAGLSKIALAGERFYYSSADSNLASRSLGIELKNQDMTVQGFAEKYLFNPIGADSFILVADDQGTFIGSSIVYATARDWARVGQLYLQNGVWNGAQVLPRDFVDAIRTPLPASKGEYKNGMWLNQGAKFGGEAEYPDLPEDMYHFHGYRHQHVYIIPSSDMVIVRLGGARAKNSKGSVTDFISELHRRTLEDARQASLTENTHL